MVTGSAAALAVLLGAASCAAAARPVGLRAVRFYSTPHSTTVTVELDAAVTPRKGSVGNPPRVYFDLAETRVQIPGRGTHVIPVGDGVVSQIRVAQYSPGVARVVLELECDASVEVSALTDPVRLSFEVRPRIPIASQPAPKAAERPAPAGPEAPSFETRQTPAAAKPGASGPSRAAVVLAKPPKPVAPAPLPAEPSLSKGTQPAEPAQKPASKATTGSAKPAPGTLPESTIAATTKPKTKSTPEAATTAKKPVPPPAPESTLAEAGKPAPGTLPGSIIAATTKPKTGSTPEAATTAKKPVPAPAPESKLAEAGKPAPGTLPGSTIAATTKPETRSTPEATTAAKKPVPAPAPESALAEAGKPAPEPESPEGEGSKPVPAARNSGGGRSMTRALGLKLSRVVIDPGHGGHDEGTRGPTGLLEKDLVLDVAQRLGALIEEQMGAEVVYTRTTNVFVPLEERTAIANRAEADLFLSLHANSSPYKAISGSEAYYLSFTTSKEALDLAARENASTGQSIHELEDLLKKIALSEKVTESSEFASRLQRELYGTWNKLSGVTRNRGVKKAPFVVLIGANMPSVLAEIGFISNPHDESLLKKPEQRQRIAEALYRGVSAYASTLSRLDRPVPPKQASRSTAGYPQGR